MEHISHLTSNHIDAEILSSDLLAAHGPRSCSIRLFDLTARLVEKTRKERMVCIEIVV